MARARSKEIVIVAALLAALGYVVAQRVRSFAEGAGRLGDGNAVVAALDAPLVRHAVWEDPQPLAPRLDAPGGETRPALSPDGRFLVFASGARGGDANLFVCALAGGTPGEARPLGTLDTPADELAPAFSDGYLYFASDRPGGAGGLDLYRARWDDGRAGEPEHLDAALQTPADETDPAPAHGDGELVFTRLGAGSSALWRANLGAGEAPELLALGLADAREPALSHDGHVLWFRAAHAGSSALWRSLWLHGDWQPAECVEELDSPADEGGPCLAANGFELVFTRSSAGAPAHLWHARSREVYLLPARPWTWLDSAVVGSLLLLALMALLARRWPALDLIYKCLLVSVLLHLLLLFLMRYVFLGGGEVPQRAGESTHKVRFVPSERAVPLTQREQNGELRPVAPDSKSAEHAELAALSPLAAAEALASLVKPAESAPASAPERGQLEREAPSVQPADVALATPHEQLVTRSDRAPGLALPDAAATSSPAETPAAQRAEVGAADSAARSALAATTIATPETPATNAPARTQDTATPAPSATETHVALAAPHEAAHKTRSGNAPALAVEADARASEAPGSGGSPQRAEVAGSEAANPMLGGLSIARPDAGAPAGPARNPGAAVPANPARQAQVGLAQPHDAHAHSASGAAPALELESASSIPLPEGRSGEPERAALAPSAPAGAPDVGEWKLGARVGQAPEPAAPARGALQSPPPTQAPAPAVALADREAQPAPRRKSVAAPAPDLVSDLAHETPAPITSSAPQRAELDGPRERPSAQAPSNDSLVRAPEIPRAEPKVERKSWDNTPYENRSGEQKARALKLHGGDEHTEEAVARGLDYLARIQQRGGNWGKLDGFDQKYGQVAVGKTGLCLLAFLGAGHTQASNTKHSGCVARAVDALIALQDPESGHFGRSDAYSHGIATYALAEDLAMTGDPRVRAALEPALRHILAEQNTHDDPRLSGGWSYYFPDGHVFDRWPRTAISAWQVMALESARLSGLSVPDATFEAARRFLENAHDEEQGNWRYNHDPQRLNSSYSTLPASTPAAMFALSLLGDDLSSQAYAPAREFVLARKPDGYRYSGDDEFIARGAGNLYFWYYGTLAMFRAGGADWSSWNESMKRTLVPAQARDGSWEPIEPYARYAQDSAGDKSYTSAMCVLSLEVYYRYYLPLLRVR